MAYDPRIFPRSEVTAHAQSYYSVLKMLLSSAMVLMSIVVFANSKLRTVIVRPR